MATTRSMDRVPNSSKNREPKQQKVDSSNESSELEYWKNKALELESKQSQGFEFHQISPNDMVEVVSLCFDKLNLNTKDHGNGNRYSFEYYGETNRIMFSELVQIKETQRNFARKGYFYINDPSAVRLLGLEEDYKKILTPEKISDILSNSPDAEKLFKSANPGQQNILVNALVNMLVEEKKVDMNLIYKISQISGVDISQRASAQKESLERNKLED